MKFGMFPPFAIVTSGAVNFCVHVFARGPALIPLGLYLGGMWLFLVGIEVS